MTRINKPALRIALCAAALLAAVGCGKDESAVGFYDKQVKAQEEAKSALENLGSKMTQKTYPQMGGQKAWSVNLSGQKLDKAVFDKLGTVGNISELNLSNTNLTDADMARVNNLSNYCTLLDLSNTSITDTGLGELKNQLFLKDVNLAGTQCTAAGVDALKKRVAANPNARLKSPAVKMK